MKGKLYISYVAYAQSNQLIVLIIHTLSCHDIMYVLAYQEPWLSNMEIVKHIWVSQFSILIRNNGDIKLKKI